MTENVPARVKRLLGRRPGSRAAEALRLQIERQLMAVLQSGGRAAVEAEVRALCDRGVPLKLALERGTVAAWRAALDGDRKLEVSVGYGGPILSTGVCYEAAPPVRLTRAQQRAASLQAAFYSRYTSIGRIAYRKTKRKRRLTADERLILWIGELEADVHNGGFGQYLLNKGRRRARAALRVLATVGARRTARMLESALAPNAAPRTLASLDRRFTRQTEDLAVLVMEHLGNRSTMTK